MSRPLSEAPSGLRLLAEWFDRCHPSPETEVQEDLRHWADLIEQLVDGLVEEVLYEVTQVPRARWALGLGQGRTGGHSEVAANSQVSGPRGRDESTIERGDNGG